MEAQELDLRELFAILRRRLWLLLLMPVIAAGTAALISYHYLTPVYQTSATVWVKGDPGDVSYSRVMTNESLALTYSEVAMSRAVAARAAEHLGRPEISADHLAVSAVPVRNTELIRLTVTDTDPQLAMAKANAFVQGFIDEIEASEMVQNIRVIDFARAPAGPVKPRPLMNTAIAFVLGLMAATGLAFLLEYLDTSIRTPEDLMRHVGGPVLVTIPHVELPPGDPTKSVVVQKEPGGAAAEAFRVLRTNLLFLGLDRPLKSLLVTSAVPAEGKSFTSANLAVALAQTGANVLLVDADLRRPTQTSLFGVQSRYGLTDVLIAARTLEEVLTEPVPGVHLLAAGRTPPNPAELLGSVQMAMLLEDLEAVYDYVILDGAPVLELADAMTLAPRVTGVLLVARSGGVGRPEVARARQALLGVNANLLGLILEGAQARKGGYYQKYYLGARSGRNLVTDKGPGTP